jgi:hypothetical protein
MSGRDFEWYGDNADVVIKDQAAVAVYPNSRGAIVIRQRGGLNPDTFEFEDSWVVLEPRHAAELARAILALAQPEPAQLALPGPADRTAADRQRRYRDRKRDANTVTKETVTPCARNGAHIFPD